MFCVELVKSSPMNNKTCNHCHLTKHISKFQRDGKTKNGRRATCGECINAKRRNAETLRQKNDKYASLLPPKSEDIIRKPVAKRELPEPTIHEMDYSKPMAGRSEVTTTHARIKIEPLDIFSELEQKYDCHAVLSGKKGKYILQLHSFPAKLVYRGESADQVLNLALGRV